jgi:hypothetical protein
MLFCSQFLLLLVVIVGATGCGTSQPQITTISSSAVPFAQQLSIFEGSQFRAKFEVSFELNRSPWQVTWYRDGLTRQRFDVSGKDLDGQNGISRSSIETANASSAAPIPTPARGSAARTTTPCCFFSSLSGSGV